MASGLRMDRRRKLTKFDRLCDRATVIIDSRGSRTALEHLLPELEAALTALHEDYDQKLPNLENDEARAQEELHINHVDTKYQSVYDAIKQYLIDRKDDACSTTSSAPSSAAASQLSAAADTLLRVKRLEDEQLRERMKLELQRNELDVKIKLQESEDAVAAAALQLQLAKAAEDPLAWERRADFDDEAVAVKLQRNDPVTCVNLATHADTISASLLPSSLPVVQVDVDTLPSSKHEVPIKLESQGQFIPPAACNIMTTLPHLTQLPNVSGAECTLTAVTGENAQCYPSRLNPQATSFQSHTTHPSLQSSSTSLPMLHCLPRLTLPKFSGLPFEWPHWFALFRSLVHNQQAISITEKMLHLQASVSGPARQVIAGFLYDGSMYPEAMRVLEARFGRAEDVVRTSLQSVFDCVLSPHCDSASLEAFQSKLHCAVTVLQQFGYQDDIRSSENVRRVAEKFPLSLKRQWAIHLVSRDQDGVKPDLALMDAWLWGQVQVQLRIDSISTSGKPMNGQPGRNQFSRRPESQAANRFALNTVADGEASALCPVCDGRHPLADCAEFLRLSVDDRAQVVASSSICFYCLRKGHILRSCRNARPCGIEGCRMRHHKCLHGSKRITPSQSTPKPAERGERVVAAASTRDNVVLLQVVTVDVIGRGGRRRRVNALLDPGAQTSLCEESVLDELDLDGETQQLTLRNVEGCGPTKTSKRFTLDVQPVQASATEDRIHIPEVFSVQELNVTAPRLHTLRHRHKWHHLTGVELPEYSGEKIQLLIGANVLEAVIQHEVRQGSQGQPVGVKTAFGWTLTGCVSDLNIFHERQVMHIARNSEDSTLVEHLKAWWSTESFGSKFQGQPVRSMEDERAFRILKQTSAQRGTQYEAGLLWNADEVYMPNNYTMALHRLTCLERRLSQNSELAQKYGMQIQTLINKGFARKLTESELRDHSNKSWLLPHHPVLNPKKGKVRLVFDAAAVYRGVSLNDKLLAGPDLLTNLTTVLIRFREEKVAVAGDIEHMFHQVQVIASDQPALRFLWRDMVTDRLCDVYQMTVHIFGAKCSPTVANYTLLKIAEDHCDSSPAELEAASAIRHNFYMDDFLRSEETTESAIRVQRNVTNAVKKGGFRLHKWASNSPEVMAAIPQGERSDNTNDASMPINHDQRTLGYIWDTHNDTLRLGFSMPVVKPTKRNVLRCMASVFDPLGLFAPFTLRAKLLIQEMWSRNEQWDDELDEDHRVRWRAWIEQSDGLPDVEIPRCYKDCYENSEVRVCELHVFCDASEVAFAASVYSRQVFVDGRISVRLVMSRSRLAPLKGLSIVRLELQAAVLAVRLASVVKTSLSYTLDGVVYWSDSKVVIQYLRSQSRRFNTFVANRVAEVHDLSDIGQWRHVPGSLNPADVCSRGTCLDGLISLRSWWEGPKFLRDDQRSWPSQDGFTALSLDDPELRKSTEPVAVYACSTTVAVLPCPGRFSSLLRYKRIVAWVLRFLNNLYSRHGVKGFRSTETGPLTGSELSEAHNTIVRECQFTHFRSEIDALRAGKGLHSSSSLLQLSPFLDRDNILKVDGRIRAATVSTSVKFPIILSNKDPLANLIIARTHTECAHAGLEHTLNLVRCQYWIPKARSLIKGVLRRCAFCAKRRARPSAPKMADLPADRFNTTRPFHIVGLDYFGPLEVHKLRKTEKRYVLLITCMSTRAVHLEISHTMNTDSFLLALRRFFARRGRPAKIYSDNGKNFVGGERELQRSLEEWNQSHISDALSQHHIDWHFNPPSSPHMGGVWERLVASVKRSLKAVLGRLRLTDEVLETVMAEMEFLVNSRPITYVSSDVRDVEALTPNHFLLGRVGSNLSPGVFTKNDVIGRKHWRQSQALVNQLWRRWIKEFIPSLLRRQKWSSETDNFKEDEVVLMVDDCQPRGHWPLARVVKTHPGQDGRVRVVEMICCLAQDDETTVSPDGPDANSAMVSSAVRYAEPKLQALLDGDNYYVISDYELVSVHREAIDIKYSIKASLKETECSGEPAEDQKCEFLEAGKSASCEFTVFLGLALDQLQDSNMLISENCVMDQ